MKRIVLILLNLLLIADIFAQKVELLISTNEVYETPRLSAEQYCESWPGPSGMYVDEVEDEVNIITRRLNKCFSVQNGKISKTETLNYWYDLAFIKLGDVRIGCEGLALFVGKNDFSTYVETGSGVCFILKKNDGYIVYYVDDNGIPGAVDTEGRIYTNKEAIAYLKKYDSEKYAESLVRADELGMKKEFENAGVLIWGKRYYSTIELTKKVFGKTGLIRNGLIQYDMQGNAYQIDFAWWGNYKKYWGSLLEEGKEDDTDFICEDVNGIRIVYLSDLNNYSQILGSNGDYQEIRPDYSVKWYVGFGGNIYYMVAGEEYTEVFRIRRTWGDPDFYAMAINGYTDDEYGKYVDEVLPKLSKEELRLLRNTVFALYGVHFKSEDLSKHFDKEVWYTDEGKTAGEVELPSHRRKLVEMILELEK